MFRKLAWIISTLTLASTSQGQRGYIVELKAKNVYERSQIARYLPIDHITQEAVYSAIDQNELIRIKENLNHKIVRITALTAPRYDFYPRDELYHTYKELLQASHDLQNRYPHIVKTYHIGTTVEGRPIPLIHITHQDHQASSTSKPGILFIGSHHAREHLSAEIPLLLAQHLAQHFQSDPVINQLIRTRDIYIVPLLNVDGKRYDISNKFYHLWRKNRSLNGETLTRGVDLNRNYDHLWGQGGSSSDPKSNLYMGPAPFSEPETQTIKNLIESTPSIRIILSYHSYGELILYPWGGLYQSVGGVDQQIFEKMATTMAEWNGYTPQQSSELYIATGDACDWAYGTHKIYCFTFELGPRGVLVGATGFYPGPEAILPTFTANLFPALYLIEHSDNPARVLTSE